MVASLSVLVGEFAHKVATLKEQLGNQLLSVVESFRKKNTEMKRDRYLNTNKRYKTVAWYNPGNLLLVQSLAIISAI